MVYLVAFVFIRFQVMIKCLLMTQDCQILSKFFKRMGYRWVVLISYQYVYSN